MTTTARLHSGQPTYDESPVLAAATPLVLVFDLSEKSPAAAFHLHIANIGATNAINTTKIELGDVDSDTAYEEQTAVGTAFGSLAAAAKKSYGKWNDAARFVRVTLTSTSGTTARVTARVG
jgi:hypothetical protein